MRTFHAAIIILLSTSFGGGMVDAQDAIEFEFFESKIRPVLVTHCYRCHSDESGKAKGGLQLDSRAGWQIGGDSGAAIVPGKPEESLLIEAISRSGVTSEMPPNSHLPENVIDDFREWISRGAADPREGGTSVEEKTSIDIEAGRQYWSFRPRQTFSSRQSIDGFVVPQAPDAPADKLVRRLFLDLIGLPPTQDERAEFVRAYNERSPEQAVSTFADRLMGRHEFGEKWARHWLDVVRYADSNGGDFNLTFHEAWRYRNYVIDAFNDDLPFDQFLREQIAGDLLPAETSEQRNRQLIATGFLMVSPKMLTERDKAKMHLDIADEQVDTIGRAFMGLTLGCARCHDHKFDPIPTSDYYAMTGILHSTRTADRVLMNNVNVTGWTNTDLAVDEATRSLIESHTSEIEQLEREIELLEKVTPNDAGIVVDDTEAEKRGRWRKSTLRPNHIGEHYLATDKGGGPSSITWKATLPKPGDYELRVSFGGGGGLAKTATYLVRHAEGETEVTIDQTVQPNINGLWYAIGHFSFAATTDSPTVTAEVKLTDKDAGGHVIADAIQLVRVDDLEEIDSEQQDSSIVKLNRLRKQLKEHKANVPKTSQAMAAQDVANERFGDLHIRIRGETNNLGRKVPRGFLQVASFPGPHSESIADDESGRRQLADWLAHPNHPLTARVISNRIWQQLFGKGIVATSDNFGVRGTAPSHPELLDYLAGRLVDSDWSMKTLIREIIDSKSYRQAAKTASADDPDNLLLRHQNRRPLTAEAIRDSFLMIAGQLDPAPRESVVKELGMYAIETSGKRHKSLGETDKLRQRSIYMPIVRGAVPPSLAIFDLPNPDLVTGRRSVTTVPAQSLFMMNSPFVKDMAQAVGEQLSAEKVATSRVVQNLHQRILVRDADDNEIAMGSDYIAELMADGNSRSESIASYVQILFSSAEFRFIE